MLRSVPDDATKCCPMFQPLHNGAQYIDTTLQTSTQRFGEVVVRVFDEVLVQVAIESSGVQHHKLSLKLIRPQVVAVAYLAQVVIHLACNTTKVNTRLHYNVRTFARRSRA